MAPPDSDLAFVKVTLRARTLAGADAGDYVLRWTGGGKVRRSSALHVTGGRDVAIHASLALYVRARRDPGSGRVVGASDHPRDSLRTTLALLRADDDSVATQAPVDVGDCLTAAADSADGEVSVPLGGGVHVVAAFSAKSMGDGNKLSFAKRASSDSTGSTGGYPSSDVPASAVEGGGGGTSSAGSSSSGAQFPVQSSTPAAAPATAVPSTVAVDTAAKLERLRQDVVDKADQINSLKQQTAHIDQVLQAKTVAREDTSAPPPPVQSAVMASLSPPIQFSPPAGSDPGMDPVILAARIRSLEEERNTLDRERAEAERKVNAHVQHAAKIKTTYNQLAAWYNNLRHEHAELQARHPESTSESSRELPTGMVATTHEADARSLEKERDGLRRELDEQRAKIAELNKKHDSELHARAVALTNLQQKYDSREARLQDAESTEREMQTELVSLRVKAADADSLVTVRAELAAAVLARDKREEELDALKIEHRAKLSELQKDYEAEKAKLADEAAQSAASAREQSSKNMQTSLLQESLEAAAMQEAETEEKLRTSERELERLRGELGAERKAREVAAEKEEDGQQESARELGVLRAAAETAQKELDEMQTERDVLREQLDNATAKCISMTAALEAKDAQVENLEAVVEDARAELDALREELESEQHERTRDVSTAESTESLRAQVSDLTSERDHAIRELFRVRKAMNADLKSLRKERAELMKKLDESESSGSGNAGSSEQISILSAKLVSAESEKAGLEADVRRLDVALEESTAELETLKNRHRDDVRDLQSKLDESFSSASRLAAVEKELREKSATESDAISKATRELDASKADVTQLAGQLDEKTEECQSLSQRIDELESDMCTSVASRDDASRELAFLKSQKDRELQQASEELSSTQKKLEEFEVSLQGRDSELTLLRSQLGDVKKSVASAEAERDSKIVELSSLSGELTSLRESMETASKSSDSAERQIADAQKALAENRAERDALTSEIAVVKSSLDVECRRRETAEADVAGLKSRIEELGDERRSLEAEISSTKRSLGAETSAKTDVDNELTRVNAALVAAEKTRDASLSELDAERAKLVQLEDAAKTSAAELCAAKERVEQLTVVMNNSENAVQSGMQAKDEEIEQLKEELVNARHALAAEESSVSKAAADADSRHEKLEKELEALRETVSEKTNLVEKLERDLADQADERADAVAQLSARVDEMTSVSNEKEAEFEKLTSLLKDLNEDHAQATEEYEALHAQYKHVKRELDVAQTAAVRLTNLEESVANERRGFEADLEAAEEALRKSSEEKRQLTVAVEELEEQMEDYSAERKKSSEIQGELREARSLAGKLESELEQARNQNKELSTRMDTLKKLEEGADGLVDELIRCKMDLANAWEQIDTYKRKVKQLDPSLHVSPNVSGGKGGSTGGSFERRRANA